MIFRATALLLPLGDTCRAQRLQSCMHIWGTAAEEGSSVTKALETEHSAVFFVIRQISL